MFHSFLGEAGVAIFGWQRICQFWEGSWQFSALDEIICLMWYYTARLPWARNVTYLSPRSQNDIISVICYDVVRVSIVEEIRKASCWQVFCHQVEHMPLRLSFIDEKCDIQDFGAFSRLEGDRAIDITETIVSSVEGLGLLIKLTNWFARSGIWWTCHHEWTEN